MSNDCNFASGHARHLILVYNPRFLGMANYLGPFSGAKDSPEGQELGGGAVEGVVKCFLGLIMLIGFS